MSNQTSLSKKAYGRLIEFFRLEALGGIVLVLAAMIALLVANTSLYESYQQFLNFPVHAGIADFAIKKPLLLWINDGLMAIFFLLIGLELKREFVEGQFSDRKQILLPAACAVGGMLVPMAVYAVLNWNDAVAMRGAAIPAATDIAFALGILSLLGSRVPIALKLLLTAVAVADDLGAIIIIAIFYTENLSLLSLGLALLAVFSLWLLNHWKVMRLSAYLLIGFFMWLAVLKSGVHATLAGVVLGLCIPIGNSDGSAGRPSEKLEHFLHPWVAYFILPLFAFANAGISLQGVQWSHLLGDIPMGIVLGLVVGKQAGVFLAAYSIVKLKWASLPEGLDCSLVWGMAMLCGIGFTMSFFIGSLAFEAQGELLQASYRLGILMASGIAAFMAFLFLSWRLRKIS
jgi:Na+:H+ antiporter, NhaA family